MAVLGQVRPFRYLKSMPLNVRIQSRLTFKVASYRISILVEREKSVGAYHTVLWDWNGTLLDDVVLALSIVNEILSDHGVNPLTRDRYTQIFDFPAQLYYERAGMDFSKVGFESISARYCRDFEETFLLADLFPDVLEVLTSVKRHGLRQFVLSNTEHNALYRMLSAHNLTSVLSGIKGMPDGLARSKVAGGMDLIGEHKIDTCGAIVVGDTIHDFDVAETIGVDCLLVSTGHQSHDRLNGLGCPVFDSLTALRDFLFASGDR